MAWHRLDDGRPQCDVCPRAWRLHEGQRGLCFVRGRIGEQIVLTSYGRSSGFCVDPVEKKPLNHGMLAHAPSVAGAIAPVALIATHAGYRYSGPVAASAYAYLVDGAPDTRRVLVLGPTTTCRYRRLPCPARRRSSRRS